jgi:hypothetical protein
MALRLKPYYLIPLDIFFNYMENIVLVEIHSSSFNPHAIINDFSMFIFIPVERNEV